MKRYEIVIESDNPEIDSLVKEALEFAGLEINLNYLFDDTPLFPVTVTMWEADETGRAELPLWGFSVAAIDEQGL